MSASDTSPLKYFLSGGFGGICAVIVGHPFDTIKVKLQTMPKPPAGKKPLYSSTLDCALKTLSREGVPGFYRGMSTPLIGVAPIYAISFSIFGFGKWLQQKENEALTKRQVFVAGAISGLLTGVLTAPGERVKCLLQVQRFTIGPRKYNGPIDVIRKLLKEGGIRSVYRGTVATVLRDVPSNGLYFTAYDWVQTNGDSQEPSLLRTLLAGGFAGICWCVGIPADVLKSRLQTAPDLQYPAGVRDVLRDLLREEGVKSLYRGSTPVLMRAFPANAACFVVFEYTLRFLEFKY